LAQGVAFGAPLAERGVIREWIALSRIEIDQARLLTLNAAWKMDAVGNKAARREIALFKVVAARMACQVIDRATGRSAEPASRRTSRSRACTRRRESCASWMAPKRFT
jgi:Acyl-CoA dehydrogenase, C-terminal domain